MAKITSERRNLFTGLADLSDGLRLGATESWRGDGKAVLADLSNPDGATVIMERREVSPGFAFKPWLPCRRATFGNHHAVQLYASGFEYRVRLLIPSGNLPVRLTLRNMDSVADGVVTKAIASALIQGELAGFGLPDDGVERYGDVRALLANEGKAPLFVCYDPDPALQAVFGGLWEKSGVSQRKIHIGDKEFLLSTAIENIDLPPPAIGVAAGQVGGPPIGRPGPGTLSPIPRNIGRNGIAFEQISDDEASYAWQAPATADSGTLYELVIDGRIAYIGPNKNFRQTPLPSAGVYDANVRVVRADGQYSEAVGRSITIVGPAAGGNENPGSSTSVAPPTGLTATAISGSACDVNWIASNPNTDVAGYRVTVAGAQVAQVSSTSARVAATTGDRIAVLAYTADGRVSTEAVVTAPAVGSGSGGGTDNGNGGGGTPGGASQDIPPARDLTVERLSNASTTIDISWTASTDRTEIDGYRILVDGVQRAETIGDTVRMINVPNEAFQLIVRAFGPKGVSTDAVANVAAAPVSGGGTNPGGGTDTGNPGTGGGTGGTSTAPAPTNARVVSATANTIAVAWTRPVETNVVRYVAYQDDVEIANFDPRPEDRSASPEQSYTFRGLTGGDSYVFEIASRDSAGNDSARTRVIGTAAGGSSSGAAPAAPTNAEAIGQTDTTIALVWNRPPEDNVTRYVVYRNDVEIADFDPRAEDRASQPRQSYTFRGLNSGTSYILSVASRNASGVTSARASVTSSTTGASSGGGTNPGGGSSSAPAPTNARIVTTTDTTAAVAWTRPSEANVTRYVVYRDGTEVADFDPRAEDRGVAPEQSYTFRNLGPGTSYTFAVASRDAAGNTSARSSVTGSTTGTSSGSGGGAGSSSPAAPTGARTVGETANSIALVWARPPEDNVARYVVFRDGTEIADFDPRPEDRGSSPEQSYTFRGLNSGTSYLLAVASRNANGVTSARSSVTGTTA